VAQVSSPTGCSSSHPTNSVQALNEIECLDVNQRKSPLASSFLDSQPDSCGNERGFFTSARQRQYLCVVWTLYRGTLAHRVAKKQLDYVFYAFIHAFSKRCAASVQ